MEAKKTFNLSKLKPLRYVLLSVIVLSSAFSCKKIVAENEEIRIAQIKETASPKPEKIRFVVTGDTGTGAQGQYKVAKAMEEKCKKSGCDFAILVGDNIYNSGVESVNDNQFITKFETPYQNLNFKFYLVLGNHDYRGNVQAQIDYTAKSSKWTMPAKAYSFTRGPVDFFAIDTNIPSKSQGEELTKKLEASKAKWKIVFGHHPRYTNSVYKNQLNPVLKDMLDSSLCNRAQLYLAGHEHDKQHLKAVCGVEHVILGSGGGVRKLGTGPNTLFGKASLGFGWFEADESKITFQILDTEGNVEYQYTINKK